MERIKDLSKIIIQDEMVLMKIVEKQSKIILSEEADSADRIDYCIVTKTGPAVHKYEVGDIVLRFSTPKGAVGYMYQDGKYVLVHQVNITVAVKPDDIDLNKVVPNKLILN
jgi:hypothetical protein